MTTLSILGSSTRSSFVRVRALPAVATRRNASQAPALRVTSLASTAGDAAVSRALAQHAGAPRPAANPKKQDAVEFRLIFTLAFAVFLLTSVIERAMPHKWAQRVGDGEVRKSVFEQAREAAHISAAYAFMG